MVRSTAGLAWMILVVGCAGGAPPSTERRPDSPDPSRDPEPTADAAPAPMPTAEPTDEPTSEPTAEPTPTASAAPPPAGKPCVITDSNGPLPGGVGETKGCDPGEICECAAQAGYSCSGTCRPASGAVDLSGIAR